MKNLLVVVFVMICWSFVPVFSATPSAAKVTPESKVRYKSQKEHNFGAATINGSLQRPDIAVVTGNEAGGDNGLLRLRENFMDRIASDFAEEVQ